MDKTYLYTKGFIDQETKRLNQPLKINAELELLIGESETEDRPDHEPISERQLQQAISKTNLYIRRHNRNIFPRQVVNQIVQQILKCEHNKLLIVNEKLMKIELMLKPMLMPDFSQLSNPRARLEEFGGLVADLPEARYLFVDEDSDEDSADADPDADQADGQAEEPTLVQDEQERVDGDVTPAQYRRHLQRQTERQHWQGHDAELLPKYDAIRTQLLGAHRELHYNYAKLEYLRELRDRLRDTFRVPAAPRPRATSEPLDSDDEPEPTAAAATSVADTSIANEINVFRVLVEKIAFRLQASPQEPAALRALGSNR